MDEYQDQFEDSLFADSGTVMRLNVFIPFACRVQARMPSQLLRASQRDLAPGVNLFLPNS